MRRKCSTRCLSLHPAWSNSSKVDLTHRGRILTLRHNYDALKAWFWNNWGIKLCAWLVQLLSALCTNWITACTNVLPVEGAARCSEAGQPKCSWMGVSTRDTDHIVRPDFQSCVIPEGLSLLSAVFAVLSVLLGPYSKRSWCALVLCKAPRRWKEAAVSCLKVPFCPALLFAPPLQSGWGWNLPLAIAQGISRAAFCPAFGSGCRGQLPEQSVGALPFRRHRSRSCCPLGTCRLNQTILTTGKCKAEASWTRTHGWDQPCSSSLVHSSECCGWWWLLLSCWGPKRLCFVSVIKQSLPCLGHLNYCLPGTSL